MKTFKSTSDLAQLAPNEPTYQLCKDLITNLLEAYGSNYNPDDDGYIVLIEKEDVNRVFSELLIPYSLKTMPYEGVSIIDGHYYGFYLANNQFGIGFVIPMEEWLPDDLVNVLNDNLDPEDF